MSAELSTELVLNRDPHSNWSQLLSTPYFIYPVHVSLSFLFTPTLSSALYLTLLRFLNRNYFEVFRLAEVIGTDTGYTPEEKQIFQLLRVTDRHPDALACSLLIHSVTQGSEVPQQVSSDRMRVKFLGRERESVGGRGGEEERKRDRERR